MGVIAWVMCSAGDRGGKKQEMGERGGGACLPSPPFPGTACPQLWTEADPSSQKRPSTRCPGRVWWVTRGGETRRGKAGASAEGAPGGSSPHLTPGQRLLVVPQGLLVLPQPGRSSPQPLAGLPLAPRVPWGESPGSSHGPPRG